MRMVCEMPSRSQHVDAWHARSLEGGVLQKMGSVIAVRLLPLPRLGSLTRMQSQFLGRWSAWPQEGIARTRRQEDFAQ
jgi:hypothetical protein